MARAGNAARATAVPAHGQAHHGRPGGAKSFNYDFRGNYEILSMKIEGDYTKMLYSVLPHEITYTVFADYFRYPVPRWADEGGSVLSENDAEGPITTADSAISQRSPERPGRRLFNLKEYNELSDVMLLYAEGFSMSNYLVSLGGRQSFLAFVELGRQGQWDKAVQTYYHMNSVEQF